ncbi:MULTISPECIES: hypothetical protein [unclassified Streptomyces]|uniref:hypothetical protein n=1 Tax=unclassified Streptomyces TaxID=2593676 RepID=UPI0006B15970|nr:MULTISPECIES: hypothetical protein [unclassified Streptomyces]KOY56893.1 hypothetical protein ADK59_16545 [Streptomyces sp. XY332]TDU76804.1 hypothetical protein EDD91_3524 [Streptomyces sp. KS 21]
MTAIEQYLIDTYRASQQGAPMPPPPGRDDVAVLRSARTYAQFRAVLEGRAARHPWWATLRRLGHVPGRT